MEKELFLVVKVTLEEGSLHEGPEICDVLSDIIDVGFGGGDAEVEGIRKIEVLNGYCEK